MNEDLDQTFSRLAARRPHGIAALLLPYLASGGVDWEGFEQLVVRTRAAGLDCAVNMDTGFGDLLSPTERRTVLETTRRSLGDGVRFYAGAYPDGQEARSAAWSRALSDIEAAGATPVIVQSRAMHEMPPAEKASLYGEIARASSAGALAFELSPRFARHGEIWSDETFARIVDIPELVGAKHSSLDRTIELGRLATRDRIRPDWRVYTGNDLAIDMVGYGSDYLLGLATFAPDRFAERDELLERGDTAFLMANDDLQHLGNVGFRAPIPAYKHAAAQFLHLCGRLRGDGVHPSAPRRPGSERTLLLDAAVRLALVEDDAAVHRERVEPYLDRAAAK